MAPGEEELPGRVSGAVLNPLAVMFFPGTQEDRKS